MPGDVTLGQSLRLAGQRAGYDTEFVHCSRAEMIAGVREIDRLAAATVPGVVAELPVGLHAALLQNFTQVMTVTVDTGMVSSIARQSTLKRWRFLRSVDPFAARAYAEILKVAGIPAPGWLEEPAEDVPR